MTPPGHALLYVSNFLSSGGTRGYCEDLAERLAERGWRVTSTSTRVARGARLLDMLRTAWTRRHDYNVGVVDVFSGAAFVWAEAVAYELRRLGKPYVLTLHGGNLPAFSARWPRRVRRLLASASAVTAPSGFMHEHMRAYRADITVVPNAVDSGTFAFVARTAARPRLVWVRAFHANYNPSLAIDVLAELSGRHPAATLTMVGPDKGDGSLAKVRARAAELGVTDRVHLVGRVPHAAIADHLAAADVFINTTDVDNTPLSVLEAMAAGLCVVSTSVGGLPYLLEHERSALLVPPRDAAAMARAVERVLAEPGLAERLSRGGHARAGQNDWPRVLDQWTDMLTTAVARHA